MSDNAVSLAGCEIATHLLEDGMDIISVKNFLGHESIDTTLLYLHVAQLKTKPVFSPLDTLFWECSLAGK